MPDVIPTDGYDFGDIHEAASFVFNSGGSDRCAGVAAQIKAEPTEQTSMSDLFQAVSGLTHVVAANMQTLAAPPPPRPLASNIQSAPGGAFQNPPRWNQPNANQYQQDCMFCSAPDHFVRNCPVAQQYLEQGTVSQNANGKLTLPDGRFLPRSIAGRNMRERLDNFWRSEGITREFDSRNVVATNFLEGPDECVFAFDVAPHSELSAPAISLDESDDIDDRVQTLQAALHEAQVLQFQKG